MRAAFSAAIFCAAAVGCAGEDRVTADAEPRAVAVAEPRAQQPDRVEDAAPSALEVEPAAGTPPTRERVDPRGAARAREAARRLVERGLDAAADKRFSLAMRRFNRASRIDPDFYGVYAGYALVALNRESDAATAQALFEEARLRAAAALGEAPERISARLDVFEAEASCLAGDVDRAFDLLSRAAATLRGDPSARAALEACETGGELALALP